MTVTIEFVGFDKIAASLGEAKNLVMTEVIPYALQYAINIAQQEAKQVCPVRTGFLRDSIHIENTGPTEVKLVASAPYAGYVEFGTSRMTGRHFMQSGFMTAYPAFQQAVSMRISEMFGFTGRHFA